MTDEPKEFTAKELDLLKQCEQTIEEGKSKFLAVAQALATIRAKRLFRIKGYTSFDAYLDAEWKIKKARASQIINAIKHDDSDCVAVLNTLENERQRSFYKKLPPVKKRQFDDRFNAGEPIDSLLAEFRKEARQARHDQKQAEPEPVRVKGYLRPIMKILENPKDPDAIFESLQPLTSWIDAYRKRRIDAEIKQLEDKNWEKGLPLTTGLTATLL